MFTLLSLLLQSPKCENILTVGLKVEEIEMSLAAKDVCMQQCKKISCSNYSKLCMVCLNGCGKV